MESWVDMPGFELYYEISDKGNARSKERRYRNNQGRFTSDAVIETNFIATTIKSDSSERYSNSQTKVVKVLEHLTENVDSAMQKLNRIKRAGFHVYLCD